MTRFVVLHTVISCFRLSWFLNSHHITVHRVRYDHFSSLMYNVHKHSQFMFIIDAKMII